MINRNQFRRIKDRKILHKIKKHWVVISITMLGLISATSANLVHADSGNSNLSTTVNSSANLRTSGSSAISSDPTLQRSATNLRSSHTTFNGFVNQYSNDASAKSVASHASQIADQYKNSSEVHQISNRAHTMTSHLLTNYITGQNRPKLDPKFYADNAKYNQVEQQYNSFMSKINSLNNDHTNQKRYQTNLIKSSLNSKPSSIKPDQDQFELVNFNLDNQFGDPLNNANQRAVWDEHRKAQMDLDGDTLYIKDGVISDQAEHGIEGPSNFYGPYSDVSRIVFSDAVAPRDSGYLFSGMPNLQSLSGNLDTSHVTNMEGMFINDHSLMDLSDLSGWDTRNVNNLDAMFESDGSLSDLAPLANWQLNHATDLGLMFASDSSLSDLQPLANWDLSHVKYLNDTFQSDANLTSLKGLSDWNVGNVMYLRRMFTDDSRLNDLSGLAHWNLSSAEDFGNMFQSDTSLSNVSPLAYWNVSNAQNLGDMFGDDSSLSDWSPIQNNWWFNNSDVEVTGMLSGADVSYDENPQIIPTNDGINSFTGQVPSDVESANISYEFGNNELGSDQVQFNSSSSDLPVSRLNYTFNNTQYALDPRSELVRSGIHLANGGNYVVHLDQTGAWGTATCYLTPSDTDYSDYQNYDGSLHPDDLYIINGTLASDSKGYRGGIRDNTDINANEINRIDFKNVNLPSDSSALFFDLPNLRSINTDGLNAPNLTNLMYAFADDANLRSLNLGDRFNTSNVSNMGYMFCSDSNLQSLNLGNQFSTAKVTNFNDMFDNDSSLHNLYLNSDTKLDYQVELPNFNDWYDSSGKLINWLKPVNGWYHKNVNNSLNQNQKLILSDASSANSYTSDRSNLVASLSSVTTNNLNQFSGSLAQIASISSQISKLSQNISSVAKVDSGYQALLENLNANSSSSISTIEDTNNIVLNEFGIDFQGSMSSLASETNNYTSQVSTYGADALSEVNSASQNSNNASLASSLVNNADENTNMAVSFANQANNDYEAASNINATVASAGSYISNYATSLSSFYDSAMTRNFAFEDGNINTEANKINGNFNNAQPKVSNAIAASSSASAIDTQASSAVNNINSVVQSLNNQDPSNYLYGNLDSYQVNDCLDQLNRDNNQANSLLDGINNNENSIPILLSNVYLLRKVINDDEAQVKHNLIGFSSQEANGQYDLTGIEDDNAYRQFVVTNNSEDQLGDSSGSVVILGNQIENLADRINKINHEVQFIRALLLKK